MTLHNEGEDTDFERVSGCRRRDIWCSSRSLNSAVRTGVVEGLSEYDCSRQCGIPEVGE